MVSAEVRFGGKRWLMYECDYAEKGEYTLRIITRLGAVQETVIGDSIGDVIGRAIDFTAEEIAPLRFDYMRFTQPDL